MLKQNVENLISTLPKKVRIVPATKTVAVDVINQLPSCGITEAGENKVQELLEKFDHVRGISWHFIGNLQTNKVKYIVDKVVMIQSVDRIALAQEIEKRCAKIDKVMDVLIEVNIGREESKGGVLIENFDELKDFILQQKHLRLKGIMTVLPIGAPDELYKQAFELKERLHAEVADADILSCGMSDDYQKAIGFGSDMIRPGSILFGQRNYDKV